MPSLLRRRLLNPARLVQWEHFPRVDSIASSVLRWAPAGYHFMEVPCESTVLSVGHFYAVDPGRAGAVVDLRTMRRVGTVVTTLAGVFPAIC